MAVFTYGSATSDACSDGGDGQCDGIIPDEEMDAIPADAEYGITDECNCPCHDAWGVGGLFSATTVVGMRLAHEAYHKEFPNK